MDRYCCENWLNCCGVGDGDRYCCVNWLNCCGVGDVDRYCGEKWLNSCGVGDVDRYCCENWLNCCGVGDVDRYCCEYWLNFCGVGEVGGDDGNSNDNKSHICIINQPYVGYLVYLMTFSELRRPCYRKRNLLMPALKWHLNP